MKTEIKKLPGSLVEIDGELEAEKFEAYYNEALKHLGENAELPGFRKGKVPENILATQIPEIRILEEMAELALSEYYPKILEEEKIEALGKPEIGITKLARHNPLGFKIKTAVLPEIKLADYKKHAKKIAEESKSEIEKVEVTDKDVEDTIMDIRKSRAQRLKMSEAHEHKEGEEHDHETKEEELPEWNDAFVQTLGDFKDVADFQEKLKENLKLEKKNQALEKRRLNIMEKIIADTEIDMPELLIELEVDKILYRMESDIAAMGLKFEDYLEHMKKTREDLRKDFRKDGEKKAKLALILDKISKLEKIEADAEAVEKEVNTILEQYKDADPERARAYAEQVLTNEKIFQFLENQ